MIARTTLFCVALLAVAAAPADNLTRPIPQRIEPRGVPGGLVLAAEANDEVLKRFVDLAGGKKAVIAVLSPNDKEDALAEKLKPAEVRVWKIGAPGLPDAEGVTGVWLNGPAAETKNVGELLKLGIVCGAAGKLTKPLAAHLPDAVVRFGKRDNAMSPGAGKLGFEVGPGAALLVRGRRVGVAGPGKVTIHVGAGAGRPARKIDLTADQPQDLTALRRSAHDRAESFPSKSVGTPVVANGTLLIIGGGGMPAGTTARFVELAGGKEAKIVVLPTAVPNPPINDPFANALLKAGAKKVTVLPGVTLGRVESQEYLAAMKEATGIWFGGGRQWHFVDAYESTSLLPLMHDVLKRGGVIGGSSAGATIQGEYLCRGGVFTNLDIAYEGYERGFAFLPGVAIDQHFAQRKRFKDMTALMKLFPQYLGIGLDEATAIVVKGSVADVIGRGEAHFYDARKPVEKGKPDHASLKAGGRYDLKARKVIAEKKE